MEQIIKKQIAKMTPVELEKLYNPVKVEKKAPKVKTRYEYSDVKELSILERVILIGKNL